MGDLDDRYSLAEEGQAMRGLQKTLGVPACPSASVEKASAVRTRLIFDQHQRVADWCEDRIEHFSGWGSDPRAIGLEVNGNLRAGVVYTNYSPANVHASIVVDGGMTRRFLYVIFYNPFIAWKVRHITCTIEESNARSLKLCSHMGFVERGRLPESAVNGEDIIIMGLLKRDCRFLAWGPR